MKRGVLVLTALSAAVAGFAFADEPAAVQTSILVVGDSHCTMTFGKTLDNSLRTQVVGAQVSFFGSSSASTAYYFKGESSHGGYYFHGVDGKITHGGGGKGAEARTPAIQSLLKQKHPQFTVVALGSNQLGWGDGGQDQQVSAMILAIKAAGSACIWVGPPDVRPDTRPGRHSGYVRADVERIYRTLETVTRREGCQLIDSRPFAKYPPTGGDGMHFDALGEAGVAQGRDWAIKVSSEIQVAMARATVPATSQAPTPGAAPAAGAQ